MKATDGVGGSEKRGTNTTVGGSLADGGTGKKEYGKGEKGAKRERVEEKEEEAETHDEKEEDEEEEDDDDDDVVVIDNVSTSSGRSPPVHQQLYPSVPELTFTSAHKMDPPPPKYEPSQAQWFSPASFLGPSSDSPPAGGDQSTSSATAGAQRLLAELRQRYQPWSVFFRCAKFGCPPGVAGIGPRIKHNLATFTANYLCLFAILLLYCVLTSLLMLLSLIVLGGLIYSVYQFTQKGPVLIGAYEIPPSLLYSLALMLSIPLFWLADAGSVMYWVLGFGVFLMLSHSTLYASEEVPGSEFEVVTA